MTTKLITMPGRQEIIDRLTRAIDDPWSIEHYYPLIARSGGTERAGFGLPLMFTLAIADVTGGDPALFLTMQFNVPTLLRALVDDPEALSDALETFYELHPQLRPEQ